MNKGIRWLVGCFGFNGPLRQYFSLYRAVSQREGERGERIDESKNVQTTPTRTYCKRNRPLPYRIKIVGRPGTGSLPSTIAPPDHPRDKMDAYLKRFERFAESAGWDGSRWATNLSKLLQGTALDVYSRLSSTEAIDYDIVRTSLLKRFQLTEEGFRLKFRRSTPEKGETASQFVTRIDSYLKHWMNLAKVEETYDGINDLFLREQFMNSVQKNLQIFLKEHKIQSVKAMVELAEQYNEAHGIYGEPAYGKYQKTVTSNTQKNASHLDNQNPKVVNQGERYCYFCHSSDHFVKN